MAYLQRNGWVRAAGLALGLAVVMVAAVWVRVLLGSMGAYEEGERSLAAKEYIRAITSFDRAIHWYAPLNPYVERAAKRLWEISEQGERDGDRRLSLLAVRTIEFGFRGAGGLYQPGKEWIERCREREESLERPEWGKETKGPAVQEREPPGPHETRGPRVLWTLILEIGLVGWIGTVSCFLLGLKKHAGKKVFGRGALWWGGLFILSYCLWIIGMMKA